MFILNVKGWGDREEQYYPVNKGHDIEQMKADSFATFDMEIDYYVTTILYLDDAKVIEEIVEEGIVNEGVYA